MANQADRKDFGTSPIRGHTADSADHDTVDSCPPAMQIRLFPTCTDNGESYTAMKVNSNGLTTKETARTSKGLRVNDDGSTIQYASSGYYLWLNDDNSEDFKLEMSKFLPDKDNPLREKYLFKWIPKKSRAGLVTVLTYYYVVLDTSTSPPKNLKIVTKPDDNGAAFIHRSEYIPNRVLLFFNYNDKYYQIKVENGVPIVEERKSQDDLDPDYMWIASL